MNKEFILAGVIAFLGLSGCRQEAAIATYESTAIVELNQSAVSEEPGWVEERNLIESGELLEKGAKVAHAEIQEFTRSLSFEFQEDKGQLLIRAVHSDRETARRYADAMAEVYLEIRNERATRIAREILGKLNGELEAQAIEVESRRKELTDLIEEQDIFTLDQDRMTFEKAKKALEEANGFKKP